MPAQANATRWCFLRDNSRLRGLVLYVKEQRGWTAVDLAEMIDCDPDRVRKYLNGVKPNLSQILLVKLCDKMGIEVDLQLSLRRYN